MYLDCNVSHEDKTSGITTNPSNVKAEVGKKAVMSCVTTETKVPLKVTDISWTSGSGNMDNTEVTISSVDGSSPGQICRNEVTTSLSTTKQ